ncbi:AP2/ERF family transcription factor [Variovorax soli]|jgi:hypothetical protein|uniref:AP2/ERF family transcription factor n=1 Tax=Variovorax soli TaxID=376815 RepID=UPI00137A273F|nr:AP2/ERF family transcription factor [Variovorax soli]
MTKASSARKSAAMYGISAIDHRFQVIIKRNGKAWRKTFSHSTCGGEQAALAMAQAWRDDIVRQHPPISRRKRAQKLLSTNTSGVAGVHLACQPDGTPRLWTARTVVGDKALSKSFSISRYGEERAKELAIRARQAQLRELVGRLEVHPQEAHVRRAMPREDVPAPLSPTARAVVVKCNNSSGIPGVYRREPGGGRSSYWVASTAPAGAPARVKCFSVKTYGEERAKALAIAERKRQLEDLADAFRPRFKPRKNPPGAAYLS